MKKMFFVIDGCEYFTSYSDKTDGSECFTTLLAAEKRASALAKSEPGKVFYICQSVKVAMCQVSSPVIQVIQK